MTKKARTITVDEDLWSKIEAKAKEENRPVSNFIETILKHHFESKEKPQSK